MRKPGTEVPGECAYNAKVPSGRHRCLSSAPKGRKTHRRHVDQMPQSDCRNASTAFFSAGFNLEKCFVTSSASPR